MNESVNEELDQMYGKEADRTNTLNSDTLRVPLSELKMKPPIVVAPDATVKDAISVMVEHRLGCVMVCEGDKLVGVFTERDVVTRVAHEGRVPGDTKVADVMTTEPQTLTVDHQIAYAINFMHIGGFRHIPIIDEDGGLRGLVGVRDVLRYLSGYFPEEVRNLPPASQSANLPREGG